MLVLATQVILLFLDEVVAPTAGVTCPQTLWRVGVVLYHVRSDDTVEELAVNVCLKTDLMKRYSYMVADTKYYCLLEVSKHVKPGMC